MSVTTRTVMHDDHVVRFYDSDDEIVGLLTGYINAAVRDDETAVSITTSSHQDAIIARLIAAEVDVVSAAAAGRLMFLGAEDTLARFMVDGRVDAELFEATIGPVIAAAVGRGRPVRACGEMVGVLWQAGDVLGAIEVERLWNDLLAQWPMSLVCTYPAAADAAGVAEVCAAHARVVEPPPAARDGDVVRWFAATPHAPRDVRHFVAETLHGWGREDLTDDALLVASELATNAVRHAASDFTVALSRIGGDVEIAVGDADDTAPVGRVASAFSTGGRGLPLIDGTTASWGHRRDGAGKLVWARVAPRAEPA